MNTSKANRLPYSFISLISAFICISFLFSFAHDTFCKATPTNNAAETYCSNIPILIIDAGHGGEDGGTVGKTGVFEKDLNLKIAQNINQLAISCGYTTVMTRSKDILLYDKNTDYNGRKKALDLLARVKIAEKYDNAIFISIHMNAFPNEKYSGLQVYYSQNNTKSKEIASAIQNSVKETLQGDNNRKIKPADSSIFVLDKVVHPAVLIECGFLSNEKECTLLTNEMYQKQLALTIFCAISNYIEAPT